MVRKFEEDMKKWRAIFSGNEQLLDALYEAIGSGLMENVDDLAGAKTAAETLGQPILAGFAELKPLEQQTASLSPEELSRLAERIEEHKLYFAWNNLGTALGDQGDLPGAIDAYRRQLEVKPDHENAWYNLGNALKNQGDLTGAIEAYRKQLVVNPDHEWAWLNLGITLAEQGDLPGAIGAYRKQLEVKPDHEQAWSNLGGALTDHGDLPGAIDVFRRGMTHESTRGSCHNHLAWIYYKQRQNLAEAEELAREAVRIDPEELYARHTLATLLACNGNWPEAEHQARIFLEQGDEVWLEEVWNEVLLFFREAVAAGLAGEAAQLLQETGAAERWRPLHAALGSIAEGPDRLTQVAPEVRRPAEELLKMLRPVVEGDSKP